jgi:hypothetical protein
MSIHVVEIVDEHEIEYPTEGETVWQDCKGVPHGRSPGVLTIFEKCTVLTDAHDVVFEEFRDDTADVMEEEMVDFDETRSASVLKTSGFVTMKKLTALEMIFVQRFGNEWPVAVEWEGPMATLQFWSEGGYCLRAQELVRSCYLQKTKLVGCPKTNSFEQMRLKFHSQNAVRCRLRFVYASGKKPAEPKQPRKGLANDMFMDDASKDLTLCLENGREEIRVHQVILRLYSPVYKQRFEWPSSASVNLANDSKAAWTLILDCLYERPIALDSSFLAEAMQIAMRDDFLKFSKMAWAFALNAVQKETVLPLLRMAWEHRDAHALKDVAKCLDKCFEFIFQQMSLLGTAWIMDYTACIREFPEMQDYADKYAKNHNNQSKKRRRA